VTGAAGAEGVTNEPLREHALMARVELPGGQWAELRDKTEITEKGRRPIAVARAGVSPDTVDFINSLDEDELAKVTGEGGEPSKEIKERVSKIPANDLTQLSLTNDYCIVAVVKEWSFTKVPIDVEHVMELPAPVYDELRKLTAPFMKTMWANFGPTKEDLADGAATPFGPSASSAPTSGEAPSTPETSPTSGEPIASLGSTSP
jgi:hypothetical protein